MAEGDWLTSLKLYFKEGIYMISCGWYGYVYFYEASYYRQYAQMKTNLNIVDCVLTPDNDHICLAGPKEVRIYKNVRMNKQQYH